MTAFLRIAVDFRALFASAQFTNRKQRMTDQDDLERGTFFTRPSNPFKDLDEKREAAIVDAEDELETSVPPKLEQGKGLTWGVAGLAIQSIETGCLAASFRLGS